MLRNQPIGYRRSCLFNVPTLPSKQLKKGFQLNVLKVRKVRLYMFRQGFEVNVPTQFHWFSTNYIKVLKVPKVTSYMFPQIFQVKVLTKFCQMCRVCFLWPRCDRWVIASCLQLTETSPRQKQLAQHLQQGGTHRQLESSTRHFCGFEDAYRLGW